MSESQFPNRWRPLRGSYKRSEFRKRGRFGPREAGSTLAFSAAIQPAITMVRLALEQMAEKANPQMGTMGAAQVLSGAYFGQFAICLFFKVLCGFFRNYGESWIRDVGAWAWTKIIDSVSVLFPGHERRVRRRNRWNDRLDDDPKPKRPRFWQRWRTRKDQGDR